MHRAEHASLIPILLLSPLTHSLLSIYNVPTRKPLWTPQESSKKLVGVTVSVEETPPFPPLALSSSHTSCLAFFQTYHAGSYLRTFALAVPSTFVSLFTQLIPTET